MAENHGTRETEGPTAPPSQPSAPAAPAQSPSLASDIQAALQNLLVSYRDGSAEERDDPERFARAGAEAIMTLIQSPAWLTDSETAALLGVSEAQILAQADQHLLPAVRDTRGQARVHRRDLSLYRMSHALGATEGQWTKIVTPIAWSDELSGAGFNPWDEITPG